MPTIDPALGHLVAIALAAIFVWSGAMKFADLEMFESAAANYRLLPHQLEWTFARVVPVGECAGAIGLLLSATRPLAAAGLVLLLCLFTAAIAINLVRGRTNIDCGCFGPALRQGLSAWLLLRNAALLLLAFVVVAPMGLRPIEWVDGVTIGLGAATALTVYASANYALGNAPRTHALEAL